MATWSRTLAELREHISHTVRLKRGNVGVLSAADVRFIAASINEALIDLALERSLDVPKFITSDTTVATVANQNYVDLGAAVVGVVDGTVRIESEDCILTPMSVAEFYATDPGEDATASFPTRYALDTDGSNVTRLLLRDTPDSVKTIDLKVESIPDEDTMSDVPNWYHGLLRSKATSIALEGLGLPYSEHEKRFNDRMKNVREKQRGRSGPQHLQIQEIEEMPRAPELRISGGNV